MKRPQSRWESVFGLANQLRLIATNPKIVDASQRTEP